ncbi:uncharacterized protein N7484_011650 [Penicillium longicatenatum]|uniref:uncharacterized protein n=1 Tax=Penicillium longicatenatum TaxID=1561947 RepID=UPI002548140A|nr:uncharacterized protein N7484_011650 [Penicillium longicatenatum]KAJ5631550.1 hypothetical protein N7484_011650 [Penicillium longicatenatum]
MRPILSILYTFLLLGTIAAAWPWSNYGQVFGGNMLDKRADETSTASTSEQTTSVASQTSTKSSSETDTSTNTKTASDETTSGSTTTGTSKNTKTKSSTTTSSVSINPAAGAGGISMLTPDSTTTTYYKIGQNITFVWNYTSVTVSPTAVDVVASCSLNSATYTVTKNMSMEATGTAIWDTGEYEKTATIPLLTASYTLFVYDADKSLSDTASAGYLGSDTGYSFGMYFTQSPTSLSGFFCVTCNGALSDTNRQGLKFVVGMAMLTVLSFTWFAGSFGLFSL